MNFKSFCVLLFTASLTACSVYYKTSDINNKLKSSVQNVNANCDKLTGQINSYQIEYASIHCNKKSPELIESERLFSEINGHLSQLNNYRDKTRDEYENFVKYTKGKDKIQSGTPEWKKFKVTKKQFKSDLKTIQSIGEETVEKAEKLNKYVTVNVVPKIQKCVVADYSKSFKKAIDSLNVLQEKLPNQIKSYSNQVEGFTKMFELTHPDKCRELTAELAKLQVVNNELSIITKKVQSIQEEFNARTKGVDLIYSCSTDWEVVMNAQSNLNLEQQRLNELNARIQQVHVQIQNIINSLKQ